MSDEEDEDQSDSSSTTSCSTISTNPDGVSDDESLAHGRKTQLQIHTLEEFHNAVFGEIEDEALLETLIETLDERYLGWRQLLGQGQSPEAYLAARPDLFTIHPDLGIIRPNVLASTSRGIPYNHAWGVATQDNRGLRSSQGSHGIQATPNATCGWMGIGVASGQEHTVLLPFRAPKPPVTANISSALSDTPQLQHTFSSNPIFSSDPPPVSDTPPQTSVPSPRWPGEASSSTNATNVIPIPNFNYPQPIPAASPSTATADHPPDPHTPPSTSTIFVENVPTALDHQTLYNSFSIYGDVKEVATLGPVRSDPTFCNVMVAFSDVSGAANAYHNLQGKYFEGYSLPLCISDYRPTPNNGPYPPQPAAAATATTHAASVDLTSLSPPPPYEEATCQCDIATSSSFSYPMMRDRMRRAASSEDSRGRKRAALPSHQPAPFSPSVSSSSQLPQPMLVDARIQRAASLPVAANWQATATASAFATPFAQPPPSASMVPPNYDSIQYTRPNTTQGLPSPHAATTFPAPGHQGYRNLLSTGGAHGQQMGSPATSAVPQQSAVPNVQSPSIGYDVSHTGSQWAILLGSSSNQTHVTHNPPAGSVLGGTNNIPSSSTSMLVQQPMATPQHTAPTSQQPAATVQNHPQANRAISTDSGSQLPVPVSVVSEVPENNDSNLMPPPAPLPHQRCYSIDPGTAIRCFSLSQYANREESTARGARRRYNPQPTVATPSRPNAHQPPHLGSTAHVPGATAAFLPPSPIAQQQDHQRAAPQFPPPATGVISSSAARSSPYRMAMKNVLGRQYHKVKSIIGNAGLQRMYDDGWVHGPSLWLAASHGTQNFIDLLQSLNIHTVGLCIRFRCALLEIPH